MRESRSQQAPHGDSPWEKVVEGVAAETGERFSAALVRSLSEALDVAGAKDSATAPSDRLRPGARRTLPGPGHSFRYTFDIGVDLDRTGTAWTATIDIPKLGLLAAPLEEVAVGDDEIHFVLSAEGQRYLFDGRLEGHRIYGDFTYNSRSVPFVLDRQ